MAGLVDVQGNQLLPARNTSPSTPSQIRSAMAAQGMDGNVSLGPGRPQSPSRGYSIRPRASDYPVGVNSTTTGRTSWGRTSFATLKAIIEAYDVARMCINHKIDELRSMEPMFVPADGVKADVSDAIDAARTVMAFPDRELPFDGWMSMAMENALRYDAPVFYKRRNYDGEIISYEVLDGTTFVPFIDDHGRRPEAPAPAYAQRILGQINTEYTREDVTYLPFRPQADNPYGLAPMESILLTANTDIRFQMHFLELFTDGTVPGGFIELPEDISSPDQIEEWQDYWDAFMEGDQTILHHLIAVPAGTTITETRPKTFEKEFPQYLMSRTAAAFGVVPQDLGFVDDVNRANGETQVDVQFRVNTLPWVRWIEGIVSRYLQMDLGLPVRMRLDTGRDKEDRLTEMQAWDTAVRGGAASIDEWRQNVLGLEIDNDRPTPRGIISDTAGFIPLSQLFAVSGKVDSETGAPTDDAVLPVDGFSNVEGTTPHKEPGSHQYMQAPVDPDDPSDPASEVPVPGTELVEEAPADEDAAKSAATEGVTVGTGIAGIDLITDEDDLEDDVELQKSELAAFRRFTKTALRRGKWRDFAFTTVDGIRAHRLNDQGRAALRKAAGEVIAAGVMVRATDTGRVLVLQRALDPDDPAQGLLEFPGGHIEDGESPFDAAVREWQEETGALLPAVALADAYAAFQCWGSEDGVYTGFLVDVDSELPVRGPSLVGNPDDPDGDGCEAILWLDPESLVGNPLTRPELALSMPAVLALLAGDDVEIDAPVSEEAIDALEADPSLVEFLEQPPADGTPGNEGLFKQVPPIVSEPGNLRAAAHNAAVEAQRERAEHPEDDAGPLVKGWRDTSPRTPQHRYDLAITDHYTPLIAQALTRWADALPLDQIATDASTMLTKDAATDALVDKIRDALTAAGEQLTEADLDQLIREVIADGYLAGGHSGMLQVGGHAVTLDGATGHAIASTDWDGWEPGDTAAALKDADGGLAALLDQSGATVKGIKRTTLDVIGNKIAAGLQAGHAVDTISRSIRSEVGSTGRATMIAHTETARAVTAAAFDVYQANGIGEWELLLSDDACDECVEVANGNPYPTSDASDLPPIHPYCRCASSPISPMGDGSSPAPTTDDELGE